MGKPVFLKVIFLRFTSWDLIWRYDTCQFGLLNNKFKERQCYMKNKNFDTYRFSCYGIASVFALFIGFSF